MTTPKVKITVIASEDGELFTVDYEAERYILEDGHLYLVNDVSSADFNVVALYSPGAWHSVRTEALTKASQVNAEVPKVQTPAYALFGEDELPQASTEALDKLIDDLTDDLEEAQADAGYAYRMLDSVQAQFDKAISQRDEHKAARERSEEREREVRGILSLVYAERDLARDKLSCFEATISLQSLNLSRKTNTIERLTQDIERLSALIENHKENEENLEHSRKALRNERDQAREGLRDLCQRLNTVSGDKHELENMLTEEREAHSKLKRMTSITQFDPEVDEKARHAFEPHSIDRAFCVRCNLTKGHHQ